MPDEQTSVQTEPQVTAPRAELRALGERLVGTWKISGGTQGETSYEWMDGGFFLIQRGRVSREGDEFEYMQIIGYDRTPEGGQSDEMVGRLYTSRGDTLRYVCEADDTTMTIWFGEKGSPAVYRGRWGEDGNTVAGAWEWPGGGYEETMTRV
jgi:hypothetical protein